MVKALAVLAVVATLAPAAHGSAKTGFSFGRVGGNISPFTVDIAADGRVKVTGSARVGRTRLTRAQLVKLNTVAMTSHFISIAAVTNCPGTLPDVAATFVRVEGRTVRVHGSCLARYQRMWTALTAAVKLAP